MMPVWVVNLIKIGFPRLFTFARLTKQPLIGKATDHLLFEGDDVTFLPRDNTVRVDRAVEPSTDMVLPSRVVEHFTTLAKHRWIMNDCICRSASDCRDYPINLGCIFLGEAGQGINPKLGRPASLEETLEHAQRCREAGLVHLIGRNKLDSIWLGVGPGTKLLTICNCCPCCCLWRAIPHLNSTIGEKVQGMPGVRVAVGEECTGCGSCQEQCFVDAIDLETGQAVITDSCRGCGRCVDVCPNEAISLSVENDAFYKEMVERISGLVDVG